MERGLRVPLLTEDDDRCLSMHEPGTMSGKGSTIYTLPLGGLWCDECDTPAHGLERHLKEAVQSAEVLIKKLREMVKIWRLEGVEWNKLWCFGCGKPAHGLSRNLQKKLELHKDAIKTFAKDVDRPRAPIAMIRQVGVVQQTHKAVALFKAGLERSRSESPKAKEKDTNTPCVIEVSALQQDPHVSPLGNSQLHAPPANHFQPPKLVSSQHKNNLKNIMVHQDLFYPPPVLQPTSPLQNISKPLPVSSSPLKNISKPLPAPTGSMLMASPNNLRKTSLGVAPLFVSPTSSRASSSPLAAKSQGDRVSPPHTACPLRSEPITFEVKAPFLYPSGWVQVSATPTAAGVPRPQPQQRSPFGGAL